jgi:SAM-dependent methyltransferase
MTLDQSPEYARPSDPWLDEHANILWAGLTALELGCGSGEDTAELARMGANVFAFDRSIHQLRRTRAKAPQARLVHGDMRTGLPFADARFDIVVSSLAIHYFDWQTTCRIVAEIQRVLRPGGWLLCRVNRVGDANFEYGAGREIEPDFFEVRPGWFKRFFSEDTLRAALEPHFRVDSIAPRVSTRWGKDKQTLVAKARKSP